MTRRQSSRRQSRRALLWHVFYGKGELLGQGSIVDVNENGCRVTGCMPVEVGTHLRLCIWPTDNPTDIIVAQGIVRWARGLEFGLLLDTHLLKLQAPRVQQDQNAPAPNSPYKPVGGGPENLP